MGCCAGTGRVCAQSQMHSHVPPSLIAPHPPQQATAHESQGLMRRRRPSPRRLAEESPPGLSYSGLSFEFGSSSLRAGGARLSRDDLPQRPLFAAQTPMKSSYHSSPLPVGAEGAHGDALSREANVGHRSVPVSPAILSRTNASSYLHGKFSIGQVDAPDSPRTQVHGRCLLRLPCLFCTVIALSLPTDSFALL